MITCTLSLVASLMVLCGSALGFFNKDCKSEHADIAIEKPYLTIQYNICKDTNSVCQPVEQLPPTASCQPNLESERVIEAKLVDDNGTSHALNVNERRNAFNVSLPADGNGFTGTGVFNYNISYTYESVCEYSPENVCFGLVKDMKFTATVVNFKLSLQTSGIDDVETSSNVDELQIQPGKNLTLLCSSGLDSRFSSLGIPSKFVFYSSPGMISATATCNSSDMISANNGKWIITRSQLTPNNCLLTIVNVGPGDEGEYRCAGMLSRSDSAEEEEDWSEELKLKLSSKLEPGSHFGSDTVSLLVTILFGVIVCFAIIIVVAFIAVMVFSAAYKPNTIERRWLRDRQVLPRFYNSTSTLNNLNSRPQTPLIDDDATEIQPQSDSREESDSNHGTSEIESSFNYSRQSIAGSQTHQQAKKSPSPKPKPSVEGEGIDYFKRQMEIQKAEGDTPKDSVAPLNPKYQCPECHKIYHDDQRLFWTRHWKQRETRCPACIQQSKSLDSKLNSDSADMTGSHTASAKSVGAQGVEFFNQVMNLQPAVGETPTDSAARLNPNYKCPSCHRIYHDDQRAFWARHWKEREERCPACIEPSGANTTADSPIGNLPTDQPRIPSPHDQPKSTGANVDQKDMTFLGESSSNSPSLSDP